MKSIRNKHFIVIALFMSSFISLIAQEATVTSGGELQGVGGEGSFTIGQISYHANISTDISAGGVQQALEYLLVSGEIVVIEHHSGNLLIVNNKDGNWITFKWYKNEKLVGTSNYINEEGGLNGIYYVVVTDKDGNEFYSYRYYYDNNNTSSLNSGVSLILYPVPVEAGTNLKLFYNDSSNDNLSEEMKIYDFNGKLIYKQQIALGIENVINTSQFISGVYVILINNKTSKVIVY